ncbi:MAG TPA: type Z 30S ribosomal protein S14 [Candidatus Nitrosocosmicus sp.]|nr:type Z 30S ribosomal protein S14 [Candidatus Nitrosocosmicus sp.]
MAKKSDEVKFTKDQKFKTRNRNRCPICGRANGYMRRFGLCRICFREKALNGEIPGVLKVSW